MCDTPILFAHECCEQAVMDAISYFLEPVSVIVGHFPQDATYAKR